MANDTQNSAEGDYPHRSKLFGLDVIVSDRVPADTVVLVSYGFNHKSGRMEPVSTCAVRGLGG